jgi:hypothetical protein
MDYCTGPSFASGGFIADSQFAGGTIVSGSQQQWITRNSNLDGWSNGVWNQVFSGVVGAPAQCFPGACPHAEATRTPRSRPARLRVKSPTSTKTPMGSYNVFVPAVQRNSSGTTWASGPTPGSSIPISKFFIAQPTNSASANRRTVALRQEPHPHSRHLQSRSAACWSERPDTVVLGLGFPTLIPENGTRLHDRPSNAPGVMVSGLIFDAGIPNSPLLLLQFGTPLGPSSWQL